MSSAGRTTSSGKTQAWLAKSLTANTMHKGPLLYALQEISLLLNIAMSSTASFASTDSPSVGCICMEPMLDPILQLQQTVLINGTSVPSSIKCDCIVTFITT